MKDSWLFEPWLSRDSVCAPPSGSYRLWRTCGNVLHRLDDSPHASARVLFTAQPGGLYPGPLNGE